MKATLDPAIRAYVEASNARDAEALNRCFTSNAVVRDEDVTYQGADGVSRWVAHTLTAYVFTLEPRDIARNGGETIVTFRLTGTFPGSPIDLPFRFMVEGGKIAALTIGE